MQLHLLHQELLVLQLCLLVGDLLLQDSRLLCDSCLAAAKSLLHLLELDRELLNNLAAAAAAQRTQQQRGLDLCQCVGECADDMMTAQPLHSALTTALHLMRL
jgi:hypothetical protein